MSSYFAAYATIIVLISKKLIGLKKKYKKGETGQKKGLLHLGLTGRGQDRDGICGAAGIGINSNAC